MTLSAPPLIAFAALSVSHALHVDVRASAEFPCSRDRFFFGYCRLR
jgi:hypothetical protein